LLNSGSGVSFKVTLMSHVSQAHPRTLTPSVRLSAPLSHSHTVIATASLHNASFIHLVFSSSLGGAGNQIQVLNTYQEEPPRYLGG
jgi:hypothetical protein